VTFVQVDDESKPESATDNMNRLVGREKVDVVVGTVHSGVAMAMAKVARDTNTMLVIPNAGANEATGPLCAPHIFRTSFSNWQTSFPMGKVVADGGPQERRDHQLALRGRPADGRGLQGGLHGRRRPRCRRARAARSPSRVPGAHHPHRDLKPDAVFSFLAGGGRREVREGLRGAGLNKTIPLYGAGFLTDGHLAGAGAAADGIKTTLHYATTSTPRPPGLPRRPSSRNHLDGDSTRCSYDAGALLDIGLMGCGVTPARATRWSPPWRREDRQPARADELLEGPQSSCRTSTCARCATGATSFISVAHADLADPAPGCRMTS
jgi:branched-chain amino acid transport system substrate-binding protein